jgi:hypothetical protein
MKRAVWSEFVPYDELTSPRVLGLLAARDLGAYVAVTPDTLDGAAQVVQAFEARGVPIALWPMLARADGRWPSLRNASRFTDFVSALLKRLPAPPRELAIDLEPPIDALPSLLRFDRRAVARYLRESPRGQLDALDADLERLGVERTVALVPMVLGDGVSAGWQRFFGTPVDAVRAAHVSPMLYTSMIEGALRGRLGRRDVLSVLGVAARHTVRLFGARASVSLGAVHTGALGDETIYRGVDELRQDVAAARAAGVEHIVLFSLCGALRRPPVEAWLDALVETQPAAAPSITPRAAAAIGAALAGSRALALGHRLLSFSGPGDASSASPLPRISR